MAGLPPPLGPLRPPCSAGASAAPGAMSLGFGSSSSTQRLSKRATLFHETKPPPATKGPRKAAPGGGGPTAAAGAGLDSAGVLRLLKHYRVACGAQGLLPLEGVCKRLRRIAASERVKGGALKVQGISFKGMALKDADAQAFAEVLRDFPEVRELDLSQNRLGDLGAVALSQVLYPQGNVHQLDLTQNEIGDVGALAFIKALELNAAGPLGHEVRVVVEQNPIPEALLAALGREPVAPPAPPARVAVPSPAPLHVQTVSLRDLYQGSPGATPSPRRGASPSPWGGPHAPLDLTPVRAAGDAGTPAAAGERPALQRQSSGGFLNFFSKSAHKKPPSTPELPAAKPPAGDAARLEITENIDEIEQQMRRHFIRHLRSKVTRIGLYMEAFEATLAAEHEKLTFQVSNTFAPPEPAGEGAGPPPAAATPRKPPPLVVRSNTMPADERTWRSPELRALHEARSPGKEAAAEA